MENVLEIKELDAFYVTNLVNVEYLTGFTGSAGAVLITKDATYFATDGRYKTQSQQEVRKDVKIIMTNAGESLAEALSKEVSIETMGIEANYVTLDAYQEIKSKFDGVSIKLISGLLEKKREIKTQDEIAKTKEAVKITDLAFESLMSEELIGKTEIDIKNFLEAKMYELGGTGLAFDMIVASGENAAKPHATPSMKKIEKGDILTVDFGAKYKGYCADMTRTFFVSKPKRKKLVKVHYTVKEAMEAQIAMVAPGVSTNAIDKVGRDIINNQGYEGKFSHGTGHGFGIDVHETPYLNQVVDNVLKEGMIITIEPGIYIEGMGGVRIEQDLLVTADGCEILNKSNTSYDVYNNIVR